MKRKHLFKKRALSLLLALTMCMGMMPNAFAADGEEESTSEVSETQSENDNTSGENEDLNIQVINLSSDSDDTDQVVKDDESADDVVTPTAEDEEIPDAEPDIDAESDAEPDVDADAEPVADADDGEEINLNDTTWNDISDTKRPGATDAVTDKAGNVEESRGEEGKKWDVIYDAERDVYKITFNIGSEAEGTQVFDLTMALEQLGKYASDAKKELEAAKNAVVKPVMGDVGKKPEMGKVDIEVPEIPVAPEEFDGEKPEPVDEPKEPGKPEGLDEATQQVWDKVFDLFSSDEGHKYNNTQNVLMELENAGVDPNSQYAKDYANYLVSKANNAFLIQVFETRGEVGGTAYFKNQMQWESSYGGRGEPTDEQIAEAIAHIQGREERLTLPEYPVDKESDEYKQYLADLDKYNAYLEANAKYETDLKAWTDAHADEHKAYEEAFKAYQASKEAYETELKRLTNEYNKLKAEYDAKKQDAETTYANDKAAYDAAIEELEAEYKNKIKATIFEPGDFRKFELYLTSDSKHTYKYLFDSFTLATPDWGLGTVKGSDIVDKDGNIIGSVKDDDVIGFDNQLLPEHQIDRSNFVVTLAAEPIQELIKKVVNPELLDDKFIYNGHGHILYLSESDYANKMISYLEKTYNKDSLEENVYAYILDYYAQKDGVRYNDINELVNNNESALTELSRDDHTDGNKKLYLNGQVFAPAASVANHRYDYFYDSLFNFVYGDEVDSVIGNGHTVDGRWEYMYKDLTLGGQCYVYNEKGNPVYKVNENNVFVDKDGNPIVDETGNPILFLDENGKLVDKDGNSIRIDGDKYVDAEGNTILEGVPRPVHEIETYEGKDLALKYYMAHEEIWDKTESYFRKLLDNGLTAEQASWTSFMMAVNISGEWTGNKYQNTVWPWYNSIKLDQMDIDFSLTKTDTDGNVISERIDENGNVVPNETGFQVYYIDTVKDEDGTERKVSMYCTYDEATSSYTFVSTPSTVWTKDGKLNINCNNANIDYALMKDIVYYLEEIVAPQGYERDLTVYIITDDETKAAEAQEAWNDYFQPEVDRSFAWIGRLNEETGTEGEYTNKNGSISLNVKFVNAKEDPENPPETPDEPDEPDTPDEPDEPDTPDEPTPEIPDEPTPLVDFPEEPEQPTVEVPDEEVPLAEIPEEDVPLAEIPEEPVPLADVPQTGDGFQSTGLLALLGIAALGWLALSKKRENEI